MLVRFNAWLSEITNCAEADLPHEKTAGDLLRSLRETYGEKLRQTDIIILINGHHIGRMGGLAALLNPDDRVDVFPVADGG